MPFDGIPITHTYCAEVTGIPDAEDGVLFLTSAKVRRCVPYRRDVASPGGIVMDDWSQIISCSSLDVNTG